MSPLSRSWNKESKIVDPDLSQVFMQFGQFLTHDITQVHKSMLNLDKYISMGKDDTVTAI